MEERPLEMSQRERTRLVMMSRVRDRNITIREASAIQGVSYRQGRWIYKRHVEEGMVCYIGVEDSHRIEGSLLK